ncbi:MAG: ABC-2 family transporter protein [Chitinophagaceae bacterium]|nr:ABC-2 family transporter protein [Oligoflexus sp.]
MRYLRIYLNFMRFAASRALQFRAELGFRILMDIAFYAIFLGFYKIIFSHTPSLGGWTEDQAMIFVSGFMVVDALQMTFFADMYHAFQLLYRQGALDHYLTKPISSWFFVGFRYINFASLANVLISGGILTWAIAHYHGTFHWWSIAVYLMLLMCCAFLYFLVIFSLLMCVFWWENSDAMMAVYFEGVNFASRPHHIFKGFVRGILMTIIPFSVYASVPAQALFEQVGWSSVFHVIGVVLFFLGINLTLWNLGLRRYASSLG